MCWEFDELYKKAREEEVRRRKLLEDREKSPAPAQPAAPEVKPREPVPA